MAQHAMTDQVGVRFGIGNGVLFLLAAVIVAGRVPGPYGVALLLVMTAVLSAVLDVPHAVGLGLAGWAFATGFAIHSLGVLTFAPWDLLRVTIFVGTAVATSQIGTPA
ncbi:MAG: hypothetical protein HOQ45_24455 [Nocardioidaceae bacterium]|nr:hypothetical protein [Nocardioidaceae bacterium]